MNIHKIIRGVSYGAISIALIFGLTHIAIPIGTGYLNLSDAGIMLIAAIFGPGIGAIAGIGASLADITLGFLTFAPFTLITKMFTGFVIGIVFPYKSNYLTSIFVQLIAMAVMVAVYMLHDILILKVWINPVNVYGNLLQGILSIVIFNVCLKIRRFR